nr:Primary amine oxidase precursor [Klebsiella pneumoniae]
MEKRPHPLNSLSAAEISKAVTIVKAAPEFQPNTRFTEISLHEPDKAAVWAFVLQGTPVDAPRTADVVMLDGKHVIEAVVDLQNKKSSHGRRSKAPTGWCCLTTSLACRTSSMPAANSLRC